jgi:hypothetical protein
MIDARSPQRQLYYPIPLLLRAPSLPCCDNFGDIAHFVRLNDAARIGYRKNIEKGDGSISNGPVPFSLSVMSLGAGSAAQAMVEVNATTPISAATRRFCFYVVFIIVFRLLFHE